MLWAAPTGVLQSLLCAGLCPAPFAVRVFPSTASLDTSRLLNAKKKTSFSSKVIAQQLTLCASRWAASKLWLQLYSLRKTLKDLLDSVEHVKQESYLKSVHKCPNLDPLKALKGFEKFEGGNN